MTANSKIEWTDHTFNPWIGCTKVSPGCDNCYAEAMMDKRLGKVQWGGSPIRTGDANWRLPLKWDADARRKGIRYRVFCASLADVFDNNVPDEWRVDLLRLISSTRNLDWLILTKRIGNAGAMLDTALTSLFSYSIKWRDLQSIPLDLFPWKNVWLGTTVVNQEEADRDIPKLLATPAAVRFLSVEPMLGPIDLQYACFNGTDSLNSLEGIHWVIVGGESGHNARPMHPDWARSLRDQCNAAGVPFFFKQWGEWMPARPLGGLDDAIKKIPLLTFSDGSSIRKIGKKNAGRLLDGREWNEVPT